MRLDYWVNHKLNGTPVKVTSFGNGLAITGTILSIPAYGLGLVFMFSSLQSTS
jgi:hypothetical protein